MRCLWFGFIYHTIPQAEAHKGKGRTSFVLLLLPLLKFYLKRERHVDIKTTLFKQSIYMIGVVMIMTIKTPGLS